MIIKYYDTNMKTKLSLTVLMLLFCLSVFGQQSINVPTPRKFSTSLIQSSVSQQETIYQLQAENQNLQNRLERMEKEHERLEKEIDIYRGDVREKVSEVNGNLALWLTVLSMALVILGVVTPLIINSRSENRVKEMLEETKKRAEAAEKESKESKESLTKIQSQVNVALQAANDANASQLFAQAVNEKDSISNQT